MNPWPRFRRKLAPADWGIGMTICITSISQNSIVSVSDMMVSTGQFSADMMALKTRNLHPDWEALLAGNDITRVEPVLNRIKSNLRNRHKEGIPLDEMEAIAKKAFQDEIKEKATDLVLSRYGIDMQGFLQVGLKRFGASIFAAMKYEIDSVQLGCSFLFSGFDENKKARIFSIEDPGESCNHDLYGFWAIGNGSARALSSLFFHGHNNRRDLPKTIYCLLEAKFMAEGAGQIGDETILTVHKEDRTGMISLEYEAIKKLWKEKGAPRIPLEAKEEVDKLLRNVGAVNFDDGG